MEAWEKTALREVVQMHDTRFLSRLTGLMRGKRKVASDRSPDLVGIGGFDGKLKFLNPAWEKILGYPARDLLERPLRELMQQHGEAAVALVERLLAEDSFEQPLEFGLRCQDGTCRWFLWHRRFGSGDQAVFLSGDALTQPNGRGTASLLPTRERTKKARPPR